MSWISIYNRPLLLHRRKRRGDRNGARPSAAGLDCYHVCRWHHRRLAYSATKERCLKVHAERIAAKRLTSAFHPFLPLGERLVSTHCGH